MNKNGQITIGILIMTMVAIIVGATLLIGVAENVGTATSTGTLVNGSYTAPADDVTIDLAGQDIIGTPVVINGTDGVTIAAGNYTIDEGVSVTTGVKTIRYTAIGSQFDGETIFLNYVYGNDGYIADSGARAVTGIIVIFMALAIAVVALVPALRSGVADMIGKFK